MMVSSTGVMGPSLAYIGITFTDATKDKEIILTFMFIGFALTGAHFSGYNCNYAELTSNFAGKFDISTIVTEKYIFPNCWFK